MLSCECDWCEKGGGFTVVGLSGSCHGIYWLSMCIHLGVAVANGIIHSFILEQRWVGVANLFWSDGGLE